MVNQADELDYALYKQRWVAVVQNRIVGFGDTARQAHRAAKEVRPKDRPHMLFVDGSGQAHSQPNPMPDWFEHVLLKQITEFLNQLEQEAYLVGGAVRDGLLGRFSQQADLDVVVPDGALKLARTLADRLKAAYYPVDPKRGVGRIVFSDQTHVDIAAYRGRSLLEDLQLRDFTMNAIALKLDMDNPYLIDPLSGQQDIQDHRVKITQSRALVDDPLRALRGVRMATHFGFMLEPETRELIQASGPHLTEVSAERCRDELLKLMQVARPGGVIEMLKELDLLPHILPQAMAMVGVAQSPPHHLPVFEHTLAVMDWAARLLKEDSSLLDFLGPLKLQLIQYFQEELTGGLPRAIMMPLAALMHDIGKPGVYQVGTDGRIRFWNHPQEGEKIARTALTHWHFSTQAVRFISDIVKYHMRPLQLAYQKTVSRRAVHRLVLAGGDATPAIAVFALMDHLGTYPSGEGQQTWSQLTDVVTALCEAYFAPPPPLLLSGADVMQCLEISEGPVIGRVLRALREAQAIGEVTTRQEALNLVSHVGRLLFE